MNARWAAGLAALTACASAGPAVPAVISSPDATSRAEVRQAVSEALHGRPVTLADDAFTREGLVSLEHPRTPQGDPVDGREAGRPQQFRLVKQGDRCLLVHEQTGRRYTLRAVTCVAVATQ